jgi:hypothetical protein
MLWWLASSTADQTTPSMKDQVDGWKEPDDEKEIEEEEEGETRGDEAKEEEVVEENEKDHEPQQQAIGKDGDQSEDSEDTEVPTAKTTSIPTAKTTSKIWSELSFTSDSDTKGETYHPPTLRHPKVPS